MNLKLHSISFHGSNQNKKDTSNISLFTLPLSVRGNSLFFFVPVPKFNTILNNRRLEMKVSFSHLFSITLSEQKEIKNIGSIDMEIFGA